MHLSKEHRLWHYILHISLAAFMVLFLILSDITFSQPPEVGSNLVFGSPKMSVQGQVLKDLSFERSIMKSHNGFFDHDIFHVGEESGVELEFSDFTVLRGAQNTDFTIQNSSHPDIALKKGKIWISTKELVSIHVPQATIQALNGSVLLERNTQGITLVTAWSKPVQIIFFSKENEKIWEFILPSHHRIKFAPQLYFSASDFKNFRLSKLQKEFEIQKVEESVFIAQNLSLDERWIGSVLRKISERKSKFFNLDLKASILEISPNTKERKEKKTLREDVMTVWDVLDSKNFKILETKIKDLDPLQQEKFLRYISFFDPSSSSAVLSVKSFPADTPLLWKNLWLLETLISINGKESDQNAVVQKLIFQLETLSASEKEILEFSTLSFFKNHKELQDSTIQLLSAVEQSLIEGESSSNDRSTRQLEIAQTVFSITEDMIQKKKFRMARKLLDEIDMSALEKGKSLAALISAQSQIKDEKWYKRGEVEYAEILGSNEKEDFEQYLALKNRLLEINDTQLHSSASENKQKIISSQEIIDLLKKSDVIATSVLVSETDPNIFLVSRAKTQKGIIFSADYDAKEEIFSSLLLYTDKNVEITDMERYKFSLFQISDITPESLTLLATKKIPQETPVEPLISKKQIPSEIIYFVFSIAQNDFTTHDILVSSNSMEVESLQEVRISSGYPHHEAIQIYEESEKKEKRLSSRRKSTSYTKKPYVNSLPKYLPYEVSFLYNVDTKKASDITAQYFMGKKAGSNTKENIFLEGEYSLLEMLKILDEKVEYMQNLVDTSTTVYSQYKLSGLSFDVKNIKVKSPSRVSLSSVTHLLTGVKFSGVYNPLTQSFSSITLLNISGSPVKITKKTLLSDFVAQLFSHSKTLKTKVLLFEKTSTDK